MKQQPEVDPVALQLSARPQRNPAAQLHTAADGSGNVAVPLQHRPWVLALRTILPVADVREAELDQLGLALVRLCDGRHTIEDLIYRQIDQLQLSFHESRALVLTFLRELMRRNIVLLIAPADNAD